MRTQLKTSLKTFFIRVVISGLLSLSAGVALAQTIPTPPAPPNSNNPNQAPTIRNVVPAVPSPPATYPGFSWPYAWSAAPGKTTTTPVIDYASYMWAPFIPWIGESVGMLVNYADFFWQLQEYTIAGGASAPMLGITMTSNPAYISTLSNNVLKPSQLDSLSGVTGVLTLAPTALPSSKMAPAYLAELPGTDTAMPCQSILGMQIKTPQCSPTNIQFNADTILGNEAAYDPNTATQSSSTSPPGLDDVNALIYFLSGLAQPPSQVTLNKDPTKRKNQLQGGSTQSYILSLRSLAAAESVALSNLNFLAKERAIQPNLGQQAAVYDMTQFPTNSSGVGQPLNNNNISQLQVQDYIANRRVANQAWYTAINNASPAAVQRETLYVLAEMESQLFQMRLIDERLLATMSTALVQTTQVNKAMMTQQATTANNANNPSSGSTSTLP